MDALQQFANHHCNSENVVVVQLRDDDAWISQDGVETEQQQQQQQEKQEQQKEQQQELEQHWRQRQPVHGILTGDANIVLGLEPHAPCLHQLSWACEKCWNAAHAILGQCDMDHDAHDLPSQHEMEEEQILHLMLEHEQHVEQLLQADLEAMQQLGMHADSMQALRSKVEATLKSISNELGGHHPSQALHSILGGSAVMAAEAVALEIIEHSGAVLMVTVFR